MAVKVKRITLWRKELENRAGTLAGTLEPLANAGADLQVVMGYRYPGDSMKAAVELFPVANKKATRAALAAGLAASTIPALLVEGDNRSGMGYRMTQAIAEAGINLDFLVTQVIGRKYSAVLGFQNETDADNASALIKKAGKKK